MICFCGYFSINDGVMVDVFIKFLDFSYSLATVLNEQSVSIKIFLIICL